MKKYVEPSIEEGQRILSLWQSCTSRPMTTREIEFARLVAKEERARKMLEEALVLPNDTTALDVRLKQAKVEMLREAADRLMNYGEEFGAKHLLIMADEIEKGERE